jgi:hypothetical protein
VADLPALATAPSGVDDEAWAAACAAVRAYCGWHIAPVYEDTLVIDGSGASVIDLPTLRLVNVTSVVEDGVEQAITSANWSRTGYLWRAAPWTRSLNGLSVTLEHGYDECPGEILGVLREAASRGVAGSAVSQVGQVRMGGVAGVPGAASFMIDQQAVLDRYRLPVRP